MRLPGRSTVPAAVREAVTGRVLAWTPTQPEGWIAGTRDAFWIGETGEAIPWETVRKADWDGESSTLTVEVGGVVHVWEIPEPGLLLDLLRERVTASLVIDRRVELPRDGVVRRGFRVVARRPPAGTGTMTWFVEYDDGVDPADPPVAAAVTAALGEVRESLGQ